jgi:rhomboid protease GluP
LQILLGEYWRLVTSNFMHAGLLHLGLNCAALLFIGPEAEAVLGYRSFLAVYLLSGLAGSSASFLASDLVTVGASGALFGLLGALAAYFIRNPKLQRAGLQLVYIIGVVALNIALGSDAGSMIDNSGHIAGFISGLWLGWFLCPKWKVGTAVALGDSYGRQPGA